MTKPKNDAAPPISSSRLVAILSDLRVLRVLFQIIFVFILALALITLWTNILNTLQSRDLAPNFEFLERRAGFEISQSPEWYSANNTYGEAFIVGIQNTLNVVALGLVGATVLGVLLGVFLLSRNYVVKTLSRAYVEILRNTPLLVQLIFWYFVVILGLPEDDILLPSEGVFILWLRFIVYACVIVGVWVYRARVPSAPNRIVSGVFTGILLAEIIIFAAGSGIAILIGIGVAGAAALAVGYQNPDLRFSDLLQGIGVLAIAQVAGHLLLDIIYKIGWLPHPQLVYGEVFPAVFIGRTGFVIPSLITTQNFAIFAIIGIIGIVAAFILYRYLGRIIDRTGRPIPRTNYAVLLVVVFLAVGWFIGMGQGATTEVTVGEGEEAQTVTIEEATEEELLEPAELLSYSAEPFVVQMPERNRFKRVLAGVELGPSYLALLIGLVIYTSAFIGEIVRAGIQAVPHGQTEAARALGLTQSQTLRMIILPQALRVIIPPMNNQYLNLAKNSSLAAAVAFQDTYAVGTTVMNQSGQSITGFTLVLITYLSMSLVISLVMNIVNSRFQLVTR